MAKKNHKKYGDPRKNNQNMNYKGFGSGHSLTERFDLYFKEYKDSADESFSALEGLFHKLETLFNSKDLNPDTWKMINICKQTGLATHRLNWLCVPVLNNRVIMAYTDGSWVRDIYSAGNVESACYLAMTNENRRTSSIRAKS